jgi:Glycolipid transfer protein (GLTP)
MEFVVAMLQRLHDDLELPLPQAASEAYYATLHQYHGRITSAAFIVALKARLHSFSRHLCCLTERRCQVQHRVVHAADLGAAEGCLYSRQWIHKRCIAGPWMSDRRAFGCLQLCPSREAFFTKIKLPPGADLMQQLQVSRVSGQHQDPQCIGLSAAWFPSANGSYVLYY